MNKVFKALADPNRRKILDLLKTKDMHVNELLKYFSITQARLSHHLEILRSVELVISEKKGQFVRYSLNTSVIEDLLGTLYTMFTK